MNSIRFIQYVIITIAVLLTALNLALTSAGYLLFVKFLNFGQGRSLSEIIVADPSIPIIVCITFCCCLGLEAVRVRLQQKKISSN